MRYLFIYSLLTHSLVYFVVFKGCLNHSTRIYSHTKNWRQLRCSLYVIQVFHYFIQLLTHSLTHSLNRALISIGGNPYLQEDLQAGKSDQRIVIYFMSSEDANEYLNEIAQGTRTYSLTHSLMQSLTLVFINLRIAWKC